MYQVCVNIRVWFWTGTFLFLGVSISYHSVRKCKDVFGIHFNNEPVLIFLDRVVYSLGWVCFISGGGAGNCAIFAVVYMCLIEGSRTRGGIINIDVPFCQPI